MFDGIFLRIQKMWLVSDWGCRGRGNIPPLERNSGI